MAVSGSKHSSVRAMRAVRAAVCGSMIGSVRQCVTVCGSACARRSKCVAVRSRYIITPGVFRRLITLQSRSQYIFLTGAMGMSLIFLAYL